MRLTVKYPLVIVMTALAASVVTGVVAYQISKTQLRGAAERHSIEILESRKSALRRYFKSVQQDLSLLSSDRSVRDALSQFTDAWTRLEGVPQETLQKLYIQENPHPAGEKQALDQAGDGSQYSVAHGRQHPWFRQVLEERGYHDLFLFDRTGNLVYTVVKEIDFATNMTTGRWRSTDLGVAFRITASNRYPGFLAFFDFKPYEPSHGAPASFLSTPVFDSSEKFLGVLAVQIPIRRINGIMQVSAGMGRSERAYLVGQDLLVRNDPRLATTSEILRTKKPLEIVNRALEGMSGTQVVTDPNGTEVLVTYTSVAFAGQAWALLAEIDLAEIFAPVDELRHYLIISGLVIAVTVTIFGIWLAAGLSRPIVAMTSVMHRLAQRKLDVEIPVLRGNDELVEMARTLEVFRDNAIGRKRAEDEVTRNREILHALADNLPEFISLKDSDLRFLFVNRRFEEWVKVRREDVIGKTGHDIYDPEQAAEFEDLDRKTIAAKSASQREVDLFYPDGETRTVVSTRFPVIGSDGNDIGLGTINHDISKRKEAEKRLAEKEEQLRMTLENMPGSITVVDKDLNLVVVNSMYKEFFGDPDGLAVAGTPIRSIFESEFDRGLLLGEGTREEIVAERIASYFAGTESSFEDRSIDGRNLKIIRKPLANGYTITVIVDVTELKNAETALRTANAELQELDELKNKFLGMAAHDLRNPLSAIRGMSQLIIELDLDQEKERELISSINSVSDQMLGLLNDLLDVSAIESGKFDLAWSEGNLGELLKQRIALIVFSAEAKGIDIKTDIADVPRQHFDHDRVGQVIDNLLTNAIKFSPPDTVISTSVWCQNAAVSIAVQDHGQGISPDEIDRVFHAFEKLSAKPTAGEKSTGLGLAIVKKIVEAHNGTIDVESVLGEGTTFTFSLPIERAG